MFSSRRGTLIIAAAAAVVAGILLFVFVQQYRKSVNNTASNVPVFVASGYIPRGTAASVVGSSQLLQRTLVKSHAVRLGAITDPAALHGEVAVADIYPGQQILASDFSATNVSIASELTGTYRAIAVPVDAAHGLVGYVQTGDHVDLLSSLAAGGSAARGAEQLLVSNVLVLSAPGAAATGSGLNTSTPNNGTGNIVFSVTEKIAQQVAYVADNGKLWVLLRPPVGAIGTSTKAGH
jgi:Flp pilus assembly protein CpaB